ncbi:hypothetical protein NIES2107_13520 [Nostoc carneum NIES-2107]|nr:hypothetical protein NIES2107_13520 [Nostoc carneum NIES-2107]
MMNLINLLHEISQYLTKPPTDKPQPQAAICLHSVDTKRINWRDSFSTQYFFVPTMPCCWILKMCASETLNTVYRPSYR